MLLLLLQLLAFCAFVAVAQAGLVSHGHAFAAPAHYAAAPVAYAPGVEIIQILASNYSKRKS